MRPSNLVSLASGNWRGKALLRLLLLLAAAAAVAAVASSRVVSHDYAHLRASLLSGVPGGHYHAVAARLAARAQLEHGRLTVVPTAGSVENIARLAEVGRSCAPAFALVQDGRQCTRLCRRGGSRRRRRCRFARSAPESEHKHDNRQQCRHRTQCSERQKWTVI